MPSGIFPSTKTGIAFALFALAGCAQQQPPRPLPPVVKMSAPYNYNYTIAADRILVAESMGQQFGAPEIRQGFEDRLPELLHSCGVSATMTTMPVTGSSEDEVKASREHIKTAMMRKYNLDTVMKVSFRAMKQGANPDVPDAESYIFDLKIRDRAGKKLWSSQVDFLPDTIDRDEDGNIADPASVGGALAEAIFVKLRGDHLLTRCPASDEH